MAALDCDVVDSNSDDLLEDDFVLQVQYTNIMKM